jgi:hypothetical protein
MTRGSAPVADGSATSKEVLEWGTTNGIEHGVCETLSELVQLRLEAGHGGGIYTSRMRRYS